MWIATIFSCLALIIHTLSNPLNNDQQMSSDAVDEFYRELEPSFVEKFVNTAAVSDVYDPPHKKNYQNSNEENEMENTEIEKKLKRDDTAAENHIQFGTNPVNHFTELVGLSPLYPCDTYDAASRTCISVRQIGTTLTLGVQVGIRERQNRYRIRWFRYFKRRGTLPDLKEEFTKDNVPWNINIGGENNEMRISPVTEIDFSYNYFMAALEMFQVLEKSRKKSRNQQYIKFLIEPINIDMGTLYPGEELVIYARAFMELPMRSVFLEWSLSDIEFQTQYNLPSNMKINTDGSSVIVKELRTSTDKILTCSAFSNKNIFLARRNFLFRKSGGTRKQNSDSINRKTNFKRRKKRRADGNEGFEYDDEEIMSPRTQMRFSAYNKYENQYKRDKFYDDNSNEKPIHTRNARFLSKFSDPSLEDLPISNELFYNKQDKTESYNEELFNNQPRNKNRLVFPKSTDLHESQSEDDGELPESPDYSRNPRHRQIAVVYPTEDSVLLNNDAKAGLLPLEYQYHNVQSDHSHQKRNDASLLNGFIERANRLAQMATEDSQSENFEEVLHYAEHEKYTFDDTESVLIADCKDRFDCNIHANCHKSANGNNFCRCSLEYSGNGIFCWLI